jgi:hypothetical protein
MVLRFSSWHLITAFVAIVAVGVGLSTLLGGKSDGKVRLLFVVPTPVAGSMLEAPAQAPLDELIETLKKDHDEFGNGIRGPVKKTGVRLQRPEHGMALPANLADTEDALLKEGDVKDADVTIYCWADGATDWFAFLPRPVAMGVGAQRYNPQGRVIGLPRGLDKDDRGAAIAAFAMAQFALTRDKPLSELGAKGFRINVNSKKDNSLLDSLMLESARLSDVLSNAKYQDVSELRHARAIVALAINDQNRRAGNNEAGDPYLTDIMADLDASLNVCDPEERCGLDRIAQIHNDRGNTFILLGLRMDAAEYRRRNLKSPYENAIGAFKEARRLWDRAQDKRPVALAWNNLALAQYWQNKLDPTSPQAPEASLAKALELWQQQNDFMSHHCAWAMTQLNLADIGGSSSARTAARKDVSANDGGQKCVQVQRDLAAATTAAAP